MATDDDGDGFWLYNVPRELIDPRDPGIQKQVKTLEIRRYCKITNSHFLFALRYGDYLENQPKSSEVCKLACPGVIKSSMILVRITRNFTN